MRTAVPRVSIVIPAFNEESTIAGALGDLVPAMRASGDAFEIVVVENGSTDATASIVDGLAARYDEVRSLHQADADYGAALYTGLLAARGAAVVNFDADFIDLAFLERAVDTVLDDDGPAIVVGSKRAEGACDGRTGLRQAATYVFASVLRIAFGLRVSDTHGVKAMRRAAVVPIARTCASRQDLFDTELVLRCERAGVGSGELPVTVTEVRPPRTRFLARIPRTLLGLWRLRRALATRTPTASPPPSRSVTIATTPR